MEASKILDFHSLKKGNIAMASDAAMAYIQATLQGIKTWVRLPKDQWPAAWRRLRDPVCPLVRALYGHPDAG
eukprot:4167985-Amphidinium_carterae.1